MFEKNNEGADLLHRELLARAATMLRYLTDKMNDSGAASSTDRGLSAYETPSVKPKFMRMWACDVCQAKFPDYEEACRHEETCRANQEGNATTADPNAIATKLQSHESSTSPVVSASRHENKCRAQQETSGKAGGAAASLLRNLCIHSLPRIQRK